jgi:tRNA pseudouridine32 synthase / 23S rRNA pseudouridine746 synthase
VTGLPSRDGVGPSCVGLPGGPWLTLIDFLVQRFPAIALVEWRDRMQRGAVLDQQGRTLAPDQPYQAHTRVYYYRRLSTELPIPFEASVLFQDEHLVVADKPHFLPVTPSGRYLQETLLVRLRRQLALPDLTPVHRIDRDTAGLVLFSVLPQTRNAYAALFRERRIVKHYEAIAPWRADLTLPRVQRSRIVPGDSFMTMQELPGTANAETHIALLARQGGLARYALSPVTGRRHQLRVQMAGLGLPLVNDFIYPWLSPECPPGESPDYSRPLQLLAKSLAFTDPVTGKRQVFESRRALQALAALRA